MEHTGRPTTARPGQQPPGNGSDARDVRWPSVEPDSVGNGNGNGNGANGASGNGVGQPGVRAPSWDATERFPVPPPSSWPRERGTDPEPVGAGETTELMPSVPFDADPPAGPPTEPPPPAPAPRGEEPTPPEPPKKPKKKLPFLIELPILIGVALLLTFLIQTFVARVYIIPSGSMEQTLHGDNGTGDRILVDKVVYRFHDPRPGDVIVFKGPDGWDRTPEYEVDSSGNVVTHWLHSLASSIGLAKPDEYDLVKRVIAVGGQTVSCCDSQNRILVDGKPLTEPYVYWEPGRGGPADQKRFAPVTVPKGDVWVMGDNRNDSDDSRYQNGGGIRGVVPLGNVIGKARTIIWPPSRWSGIGDLDAQTASGTAARAPGWGAAAPATGIGVLTTLPTLWFGRRFRGRLLGRATSGEPVKKRR